MEKIIEEFTKPFERLNMNGIEIQPESQEELRGVTHREMFSFINDLLRVRGCKIGDMKIDENNLELVASKLTRMAQKYFSEENNVKHYETVYKEILKELKRVVERET